MEYLRNIDFAAFAADPKARISQPLLDETTLPTCSVNCIRTPAGGGSPAGLHVHEVDQVFYIVSGVMSIEIEGQTFDAKPGALVLFPKGVPHRNWNGGSEETVHLAIQAPAPDPAVPFSRTVG